LPPARAAAGIVMRFTSTGLEGAYVVELEPRVDERGFFARTFCRQEFKQHGRRDQVLTYEDVELPPDRLVDQLREEQEAAFA
jgi:dTDP-4-dehydrorhamnose 3,5-epimerase